MLKIKKGDTVRVIAGKDKDKEGKIIAVNQKNGTVVVEGINMITKHTKPSMQNQNGGIIHQEAPLNISNVMLLVDGQPTRVGFQVEYKDLENGRKKRIVKRVAKATGKVIDD